MRQYPMFPSIRGNSKFWLLGFGQITVDEGKHCHRRRGKGVHEAIHERDTVDEVIESLGRDNAATMGVF